MMIRSNNWWLMIQRVWITTAGRGWIAEILAQTTVDIINNRCIILHEDSWGPSAVFTESILVVHTATSTYSAEVAVFLCSRYYAHTLSRHFQRTVFINSWRYSHSEHPTALIQPITLPSPIHQITFYTLLQFFLKFFLILFLPSILYLLIPAKTIAITLLITFYFDSYDTRCCGLLRWLALEKADNVEVDLKHPQMLRESGKD